MRGCIIVTRLAQPNSTPDHPRRHNEDLFLIKKLSVSQIYSMHHDGHHNADDDNDKEADDDEGGGVLPLPA